MNFEQSVLQSHSLSPYTTGNHFAHPQLFFGLDWTAYLVRGSLYLMATTLGTLRIVQKENSRKNETTDIDVGFE